MLWVALAWEMLGIGLTVSETPNQITDCFFNTVHYYNASYVECPNKNTSTAFTESALRDSGLAASIGFRLIKSDNLIKIITGASFMDGYFSFERINLQIINKGNT